LELAVQLNPGAWPIVAMDSYITKLRDIEPYVAKALQILNC